MIVLGAVYRVLEVKIPFYAIGPFYGIHSGTRVQAIENVQTLPL
jgi:hypothetical protein